MNKSLKEIIRKIKKSNNIAIFTHVSPDFDAFGSAYSFFYAVKSLGKNATIFMKDSMSDAQKEILDESLISQNDCNASEFDLFVAFDSSSNDRLGDYGAVFDGEDNTILVDHHKPVGWEAKSNYINEKSSSCAELVLDIIKALKVKVTSQIATLLFLGLSSDTKSFINTNTNKHSFLVATELLASGAEIERVNELLYKSKTIKSLEFKKFLLNNYKIKNDCAYCLVTQKDLAMLDGDRHNCDGYSASLNSITGINYSFHLIETEEPNIFRVSLRSKAGYDVYSVAVKLGGGGHFCASGATIHATSIENAKNMVLKAIYEDE